MRKGLVPGEQVITITRPQPRKLAGPAAAFIAAPAAAAFTSAWTLRGEATRLVPAVSADWTPWIVLACVLTAAWIWLTYCLPRLLRWQGTRYILTSRRIVARYGMVRRRDEQVNLASVRNVTVHQSVVQRILRSGNISLETGYQSVVTILDVPEAARFRDFVLDAVAELPMGRSSETDEMSDYADDILPWELREGGHDER
ncbi:PH domain-containing protein [Pseudarthrobacter sulfonivorans]|uniref:PH domain-containing protein n=1 Tax=Pseudarthrobacter sulfonivorans TaxID=121292 RepID=UPI00285BE779|nr:PH domain-containing protein [Pseudarthrobacter sulfonivorans]MDR6416161.1 putative membrane protein YdbT with pleckstrin-like domain [Pseudarthrobacter sulfonivorans]